MKNLLKLIFILVLILGLRISRADTSSMQYYHINIYSENNNLFLDKNINNIKVSEINIKSEYEFYFKDDPNFRNNNNYLELNFEGFSPDYKWTIYVKENLRNGVNTIQLPYYPHAKQLNIISPTGAKLNIDLTTYATCNQNNVCEYEQGETELSCIMDCYYDENINKPIVYSTKTEQTLQANNGIIRDQEGTTLLRFQDSNSTQNNQNSVEESEETKTPIWPLILGIVLLVIGLGVFIYFRIKKKNQ